ncbi:MAG: hypothetical protein HRT71_00385 [Flavobacteriales bacterium]|nr:hypothetical protein [Flavobacteriales bacterium]
MEAQMQNERDFSREDYLGIIPLTSPTEFEEKINSMTNNSLLEEMAFMGN